MPSGRFENERYERLLKWRILRDTIREFQPVTELRDDKIVIGRRTANGGNQIIALCPYGGWAIETE